LKSLDNSKRLKGFRLSGFQQIGNGFQFLFRYLLPGKVVFSDDRLGFLPPRPSFGLSDDCRKQEPHAGVSVGDELWSVPVRVHRDDLSAVHFRSALKKPG
jgi:hypothetical protein